MLCDATKKKTFRLEADDFAGRISLRSVGARGVTKPRGRTEDADYVLATLFFFALTSWSLAVVRTKSSGTASAAPGGFAVRGELE